MLGITCITAIIMLCMFTTPVFYNTKYNVSCHGVDNSQKVNQTIEFHKDGTLTYKYWNNFDYKETYTYTIIGDKLFIGDIAENNMLTINNKFSLEQGDYYLEPAGGGVAIFVTLLLINIPATTTLFIMLGVWIYGKYAKPKTKE